MSARPGTTKRKRSTGSTRLQRGASPYTFAAIGIVLAALVSYIAFAHRVPLTGSGYTVHAVLSDAGQLQPGSPVRIAGVDVGQVRAVGRGPGQSAQITMSIKPSGLPLHDDATLKIRPRLFLEGSLYVELHPGSPSAPTLRSGATLGESRSSRAVQLDELLSTLDHPARDSLKSIIAQADTALRGGGAEGLRRTTQHLPGLLRQIAVISHAAQGRAPHDLSSAIRATARITDALGRQDARLSLLVASARTTAAAVAAHRPALAGTLTQLDALERELPAVLDRLDPAVASLRRLAADLQPAIAIAPRPLARTAALLGQLSALSRAPELPRLLGYLSPTIRRAPQLERDLGTLLPLVAHVSDCVSDQALPVLNASVPDGALSSHRPAWQDLAHVSVALTGALQDFDGNGTAVRLAGAGGDSSVRLGELPSTTELFGKSTPVLGSRPTWLGSGVQPPFRPDQDCSKQARVDLNANTRAGRR